MMIVCSVFFQSSPWHFERVHNTHTHPKRTPSLLAATTNSTIPVHVPFHPIPLPVFYREVAANQKPLPLLSELFCIDAIRSRTQLEEIDARTESNLKPTRPNPSQLNDHNSIQQQQQQQEKIQDHESHCPALDRLVPGGKRCHCRLCECLHRQ